MPAARKYRRRRRAFRRYRNIWSEYNVLRTKCEYTSPLLFPNESGQPYFSNSPSNNRRYLTFAEMMDRYARNNNLREMFGYVKVTGVRLEVIPHSNNLSVTGLSNQTPVCIAILFGTSAENAGADYNDVVTCNTAVIADPVTRIARYFSAKGGSWDLKVASDATAIGAGTLIVRAMNNGAYSASPGWNVKVTLYCYWRYAKTI